MVCNFILFSCEFYEISKKTFLTERLRATASEEVKERELISENLVRTLKSLIRF